MDTAAGTTSGLSDQQITLGPKYIPFEYMDP